MRQMGQEGQRGSTGLPLHDLGTTPTAMWVGQEIQSLPGRGYGPPARGSTQPPGLTLSPLLILSCKQHDDLDRKCPHEPHKHWTLVDLSLCPGASIHLLCDFGLVSNLSEHQSLPIKMDHGILLAPSCCCKT